VEQVVDKVEEVEVEQGDIEILTLLKLLEEVQVLNQI
jgi:hypothetical protein